MLIRFVGNDLQRIMAYPFIVGCFILSHVLLVLATPADVPTITNLTQVNLTSVFVEWSNTSQVSLGYVVRVTNANDSSEIYQRNLSIVENDATVVGLQSATTYLVSVAIYDEDGIGNYSNATSVHLYGAPSAYPNVTTMFAPNSTSLYFGWQNLSVEQWKTEPLFFILKLILVEDANQVVIQKVSSSTNHTTIANLQKYSNYTVQISCSNTVGEGPNSPLVLLRTASEAPISPPLQLNISVSESNVIHIAWLPPLAADIVGDILNYTIQIELLINDGDKKPPVEEFKRKRRAVSSPVYSTGLQVESFNYTTPDAVPLFYLFTNAIGDVTYHISINANTEYAGVFSSFIEVTTPVGVPFISAFDFKCTSRSSTALHLDWKQSPKVQMQGDGTTYTIYYRKLSNTSSTENITLNYLNSNELSVLFLQQYTTYMVWLTASTVAGEGPPTNIEICTTLPQVPTAAPENFTASSYEDPYKTMLFWTHVPDKHWHNVKSGYRIYYQLLNEGEHNVPASHWESIDLLFVDNYLLEGLRSYSTYRITVAARSLDGIGDKSIEITFVTCRIPHPVIVFNYFVQPPYVNNETTFGMPNGLITQLPYDAILSCSLQCKSFNKNVSITFEKSNLTSLLNVTNFIGNNRTDIFLPMLDNTKGSTEYKFLKLISSPGYILNKKKYSTDEMATMKEDWLLDGIESVIPMFVIFSLMMILFGIIYFFVEPIASRHHEKKCFLGGLFEGLYLAVMTYTKVGYGDLVARTIVGRVYLMLTTIVIIAFSSVLVGSLSFTLITNIGILNYEVPSDKVTSVIGSSEYDFGKKYFPSFETGNVYYDYKSLFAAVNNRTTRYLMIDYLVQQVYQREFTELDIIVEDIYHIPFDVGIKVYGEFTKLETCVERYVKQHRDITEEKVQYLKNSLMQQIKFDDTKQSAKDSKDDDVVELIDYNSPLYHKFLIYTSTSLVICILIGLIYEIIRQQCNAYKRSNITPEAAKAEEKLKEMQVAAKENLGKIRRLIKDSKSAGNKLTFKHFDELAQMRDIYSAIYGANFKHVGAKDLPLTLSQLFRVKQTLENESSTHF